MQTLSDNYLIDLANQLAFLSAFLGGFAATLLVTVLVSNSQRKIVNWLIGATAASACFFIIAVISFVMLSVMVHPDTPNPSSVEIINAARIVSILSFIFGIFALLASIGLSGWIHSKQVGKITTIIASITLLIVMWAITGFS